MRAAVYRNRRRIRGARGLRLLRLRGGHLERPFAHLYETGGMRRVYLRGQTNILKRQDTAGRLENRLSDRLCRTLSWAAEHDYDTALEAHRE